MHCTEEHVSLMMICKANHVPKPGAFPVGVYSFYSELAAIAQTEKSKRLVNMWVEYVYQHLFIVIYSLGILSKKNTRQRQPELMEISFKHDKKNLRGTSKEFYQVIITGNCMSCQAITCHKHRHNSFAIACLLPPLLLSQFLP